MIFDPYRRLSSTNVWRKRFAAAGLTMSLLAPMQLVAQQRYEPRDIPMLPAYCKHTQDFRERVPGGNNPAEIERLTALMGSVFIHMHHYCYGLVAFNRATFLSRTQQERLLNLNSSIYEFDYVIQRAPPDFVLLPEILTKKGESLIRLGRGPDGALELQRAIALKPDYWPPYAAMSDYNKEIGDLKAAREWLEKGLSTSPNTKALLQRRAELDGPKGKHKSAPRQPEKSNAPQPTAETSTAQPVDSQLPTEQ